MHQRCGGQEEEAAPHAGGVDATEGGGKVAGTAAPLVAGDTEERDDVGRGGEAAAGMA